MPVYLCCRCMHTHAPWGECVEVRDQFPRIIFLLPQFGPQRSNVGFGLETGTFLYGVVSSAKGSIFKRNLKTGKKKMKERKREGRKEGRKESRIFFQELNLIMLLSKIILTISDITFQGCKLPVRLSLH